jgi:hypothetical protein
MSWLKTYSYSSDFGSSFNPGQFQKEVNDDAGITPTLDYINWTDDVIDVYFSSEVLGGELVTLAGLVSGHVPALPNEENVNTGADGTATTLQSTQTVNRVLVLPDADDTLIGKSTTDVLQNKTLEDPVITGNTTTTGYIQFSDIATPANPSNGEGRLYKKTGDSGVFWLPDAGGAEVDLTTVSTAATLEATLSVGNATGANNIRISDGQNIEFVGATNSLIIDAPDIATSDRTITFPDPGADDSVIYEDLAQTLTNKSIDGASNTVTLDAVSITTGTFSDSRIATSNVTQHEASIDHTAIANVGTNTHAQIDTHITTGNIHYIQSAIVETGDLDTGSITSGFGSIDNGASAIATTGTISGGTISGGAVSSDNIDALTAATLTVGAATATKVEIADTSVTTEVQGPLAASEGVAITGNTTTTGYIQFSDIAEPSNPLATEGRLYKKSGNAGIFWKPDAAGPEVDLTTVSTAASLASTLLVGNTTGGSDIRISDGQSIEFVGATNSLIIDASDIATSDRTITFPDPITGDDTVTYLAATQTITNKSIDGASNTVTLDTSSITTGTFSDARIAVSNVTQHESSIDHGAILNTGTNTHADIDTHIDDGTLHYAQSAIVETGALNAGSITSGFGSIDNGASNITTTGVISGGQVVSGDFDALTASVLALGAATATKVEIADTLVTTEVQGPFTALEGVNVTGDTTTTGFIQISDIAEPSNPLAGEGRLYKKTGNDGIFWKPDAAGPEVDLTTVSTAANLAATLAAGNTTGANNILISDGQNVTFVGATNSLIIDAPDIATADRTITFPDPVTGDDSVAYLATAQTLTNKTIDGASNTVTLDTSTITTGTFVDARISESSVIQHEGAIDHGSITGLGDDDHAQYALLAGRTGGQTITGGNAASNDLTLQSTSDVTKGSIVMLDPLDVTGDITVSGTVDGRDVAADGTTQDAHITNTAIHFAVGDIDHDSILNNGTNTHSQIDTHLGNMAIHFEEGDIDHSNITGLTGNDDHTQYTLLAGRTGGQTITGGDSASNDLTLQSTSDVTKGSIVMLDPLDVTGDIAVSGTVDGRDVAADGTTQDAHIANTAIHYIQANIVETGALNAGSITSGFGAIDNGASNITTTGVVSGGTITSDDIDALTASVLTIGSATATKVEIADTAVTTEVQGPLTALEGLNVTGNIATTGTVDGRDVATDGTTQDSHIADATIHYIQSNIVETGALNAGSITSGFGAINNGASNITTTGVISAGQIASDDIDALTASVLTVGAATATKVEIADTLITTEVQGPLTALEGLNVTGNIAATTGFIQISDIAEPSNPSAGEGILYKKTGNDGIFWKPDATGPEVDLTTVSTAATLAATLAAGNTTGANNILISDGQNVTFVGATNNLIIDAVDIATIDRTITFPDPITGDDSVAYLDAAQTLTNKTIDGSSNTVTLDTSSITTGTFADARISESSVTQHEGAIDHGSIAGLGDDDHTQYTLLAGRTGGQTITGGDAASNDLTLQSTSDVTKGSIVMLDPLDVTGNITVSGTVDGRDIATDGTTQDSHIADATIHYIQSNIVETGALNAGSITSGFGAIDNGASNITTTGVISAGQVTSDDVDALTASVLALGAATATKVEIADTLVTTEIQGPLTALEGLTVTGDIDNGPSNVITTEVRMQDSDLSDYIAIKAAAVTTTYTMTMPATQGAADQVLTNDGSGNMSWTVPQIPNSIATATAAATTTSATYALLPGMILTPAAGTYMVTFSSSASKTTNSSSANYAIFINTTITTHSQRNWKRGNNGGDVDTALHTQSIETVNGTDTIAIGYRSNTGSFIVEERSLIVIRVA